MPGWLVAGLAALALPAGCDRSRSLACGQSIADACAAQRRLRAHVGRSQRRHRDLRPAAYALLRADCGGYHVLAVHAIDASRTYYYDAAGGTLIAIVDASGFTGTTTCNAGPAGGFTLPTCTGSISEPLPQCLDGGVDAIAGGDGATD